MKKRILTTLIGICLINLVFGQNNDKTDSKLNYELITALDIIYNDDQQLRKTIGQKQEQYGIQSIEMNELWKTISYKDSINQIKTKTILDKYGWLGEDIIGQKGSKTLFLIIQHADIDYKIKYLPMMRQAVKNGKASTKDLALLEDRVLMMQGKKQIYGSQIGINPETGDYFVSPIIDPENVDKRRAEVGLKPMSEYLESWNLKWDVEKHKEKSN